MAKTQRIKGVKRQQEVKVSTRRDDPRTLWDKIRDACETPGGTLKIYGFLGAVALFLSPVPLLPEVAAIAAAVVTIANYRYGSKLWDMPFRVPAYLEGKVGRTFRDASTREAGEGDVYLGREYETGEEVWATANDIRTHRLVVGTTGSGKTEEMLGSIANALMMDSGAIMIDGKSDPKTFDSLFKLARFFSREEDIMLLNYIMGGRDLGSAWTAKRSNTFNPLSMGSAAMKSEIMVSLMDNGSSSPGSDMWTGRAISFMESIIPPLNYLASRGYVLFNPRLLVDFFLLENIENLVWFGIFVDLNGNVVDLRNGSAEQKREFRELDTRYAVGIKDYLNNLPAYGQCRPKSPEKPQSLDQKAYAKLLREWSARDADGPPQVDSGPNQAKDQARAKVAEQHGYITMQLVRATGNLSFNYGHIYNAPIGEVSFEDAMLNRRIMLIMLPALERSKPNMEPLGKMAVSSVKGVLAKMLDTELEGSRRLIIDGRPSNSSVPYNIICDEYGYYVVDGFAVAPAQARSYGVSMTFAVQDIPSLKRANEKEGEATIDNTNLFHVGRMTGGETSETFRIAQGRAGEAFVQSASDMEYQAGAFGAMGSLHLADSSRMEKIGRLHVDDLSRQRDGQFHMVVGMTSEKGGKEEGGSRVIRYRAFHTGDIPGTEGLRLNHCVPVKRFSEAERAQVQLQEELMRSLDLISNQSISTTIARLDEKDTLSDDLVARFIEYAEAMSWSLSDDDVMAWGVAQAEALEARASKNTLNNDLMAVAERAGKVTEENEELQMEAAINALRPWANVANDRSKIRVGRDSGPRLEAMLRPKAAEGLRVLEKEEMH